ncbi:T9SS type A sorting domain-containing protein [Flavivirga rizhaonensis]|uniref:T9SS type A sorting domain-containing protein n=1 Tax=Flavivirga rizhaonensis TaxID=2559571 RepID=A0A4S1E284_9FLAO|nr:T9SS type A sorting domain-containing protein [Flavivirga rizhaonensis]TGV04841.1 T9SS type A sorting domain-containing protein [Flavivirga rizhaonensis]
MKRFLILILCLPLTLLGQVQIGNDINGAVGELSGFAVSTSANGNFVAVGALGVLNDSGVETGAVRVYENIANVWTQVGQNITGDQQLENAGTDVAISANGNIVVVASPDYDIDSASDSTEGRVRVFENISGTWVQVGGDILGSTPNESFGNHVDISSDGSIISVGALFNSDAGTNAGQVRVFENLSGSWIQIGQSINGLAENDRTSNHAITPDGTRLAVTSFGNDGDSKGRLRVFDYDFFADSWEQVGQDVLGMESQEQLGSGGFSISDDGTVIGIGIPLAPVVNALGRARFYGFDNTTNQWIQIGNDINGDIELGQLGNGSGLDLSPDGNFAVIGIPNGFIDSNGLETGNLARVYKNQSGNWVQVGSDIEGDVLGDNFGFSVSLSNNGIVAIGGFTNESAGSIAGHVEIYDINNTLLSTEEFAISSEISLYPNPTSNAFYIKIKDGVILENVTVYNSLGQKIKSSLGQQNKVDLSEVNTDVYFVEITTNKGNTSKRIVVQ